MLQNSSHFDKVPSNTEQLQVNLRSVYYKEYVHSPNFSIQWRALLP